MILFFILSFVSVFSQRVIDDCENNIYTAKLKAGIAGKPEPITWKDYIDLAKEDNNTINNLMLCSIKKIKACDKLADRPETCFLDALDFNVKIDAWLKDFKDLFPSDSTKLNAKYKVESSETNTPAKLLQAINENINSNKVLILGLPAYYDEIHSGSTEIVLIKDLLDEDFSSITNKGTDNYIDLIKEIRDDLSATKKDLVFYKKMANIDESKVEDLRNNTSYKDILANFKKLITDVQNTDDNNTVNTDSVDNNNNNDNNTNNNGRNMSTDDDTNNKNNDKETKTLEELKKENEELLKKTKEQEEKIKAYDDAKTTSSNTSGSRSYSGGGPRGSSFSASRMNSRRDWEKKRKKQELKREMDRIKRDAARKYRLRNARAPRSARASRYSSRRYRRPRNNANRKKVSKARANRNSTGRAVAGAKNGTSKSSYDYNKGDKYIETAHNGNEFSLLDRKATLANLRRNGEYLARNVNIFDIEHLLLDYYYRDLGRISENILNYGK